MPELPALAPSAAELLPEPDVDEEDEKEDDEDDEGDEYDPTKALTKEARDEDWAAAMELRRRKLAAMQARSREDDAGMDYDDDEEDYRRAMRPGTSRTLWRSCLTMVRVRRRARPPPRPPSRRRGR